MIPVHPAQWLVAQRYQYFHGVDEYINITDNLQNIRQLSSDIWVHNIN